VFSAKNDRGRYEFTQKTATKKEQSNEI
jgi:hypothetical protein